MTDELFPAVQPEAEETNEEDLPLCREAGWDYEKNIPLFSAGELVEVTGAEAVKVWCHKALQTVRGKYAIYTRDYGSDLETLIGQAYTSDVKQSEAVRYVREALETNPYITDVRQISVDLAGDTLHITCTVHTIYGEVNMDV